MEIQARCISLGFAETGTFAKMADSQVTARTMVADELGLRPDLGLLKRSVEAKVLSAWKAAGKRNKSRKERDAITVAYSPPTVLEQQYYFSGSRRSRRLTTPWRVVRLRRRSTARQSSKKLKL